jgi:hypothetical protein
VDDSPRRNPAGHRDLAAGRWRTLTLAEQLANVGSEVTRSLQADRAGKPQRRDRAIERAIELFDLTASDERWRGHRRREVLRVREEFCALVLAGESGSATAESLERYFLQFGLVARRGGPR